MIGSVLNMRSPLQCIWGSCQCGTLYLLKQRLKWNSLGFGKLWIEVNLKLITLPPKRLHYLIWYNLHEGFWYSVNPCSFHRNMQSSLAGNARDTWGLMTQWKSLTFMPSVSNVVTYKWEKDRARGAKKAKHKRRWVEPCINIPMWSRSSFVLCSHKECLSGLLPLIMNTMVKGQRRPRVTTLVPHLVAGFLPLPSPSLSFSLPSSQRALVFISWNKS